MKKRNNPKIDAMKQRSLIVESERQNLHTPNFYITEQEEEIKRPAGDPYEYKKDESGYYFKKRDEENWKKTNNSAVKAVFGNGGEKPVTKSSNQSKSSDKPKNIKGFQQWVINTKGDKSILGKGGDSGYGDDGKWGDKTASAWGKYGDEYNNFLVKQQKNDNFLVKQQKNDSIDLSEKMAKKYKGDFLYLDGGKQILYHYKDGKKIKEYKTSTGRSGFGNESDSGKTPSGLRKITSKFGDGLPKYAYIVGRRGVKNQNGEFVKLPICDETSKVIAKKISRYMPDTIKGWLPGEFKNYLDSSENCEAHVLTRGLTIDEGRQIYIHGTNYENSLGKPLSGGCVRVSNDGVIDLYNKISVGTPIYIQEPNNAYTKLKNNSTPENIAKMIKDSYGGMLGNDKEAWAQSAFEAITDKATYEKVKSELGQDPYEFVKDFMSTNKDYHNNGNTIDSIYNKLFNK